ncbi:DUF2487 family protein [Metabacillus sp. 84]|uniref:DUF2487 family protein n=1 Tax=unclassified Metabacillus TaxID=2675274 RepID=UPI003CF636A7
MKWAAADAIALEKEKEYIDTIVVPLIPAGADPSILQNVYNGEFITLLSEELERQFRGRLVLSPPFTYLPGEKNAAERILEWKESLSRFPYILLLTSDPNWKTTSGVLGNELIWIPSIPMENIDRNAAGQVLDSHLQQIMNILLQFWKCK